MSTTLTGRYASKEMSDVWSTDSRYRLWRRIWCTLAEVQYNAGIKDVNGISRINKCQLDAMKKAIDRPIDYIKIAEYEKRFKHDVMAHIHEFGDAVPEARDVIHLGATSCDITDNADIIL